MVNIGDKFGYLEVIDFKRKGKKKKSYICRCVCGKILVLGEAFLVGTKNRNPNKSCGCLKHSQNGNSVKFGHLYGVWAGMKARCYDEKCGSYCRYGAIGVTVCEEWLNSFDNFLKWALESGYKEGLTIDRVNDSNVYSPNNCKWSTLEEQAVNRKTFRNNKSGYTGVHFSKKLNKYRVDITRNGVRLHIGVFNQFNEAIESRKLAEKYFIEHKTLDDFKI